MKKTFEVKMQCNVVRIVSIECDTVNEAWVKPLSEEVKEISSKQTDWTVISVKEKV